MDELKEVKIRLKLEEGDKLYSDIPLTNSNSAVVVMHSLLKTLDREHAVVVNLDSQLRPLNYNIVSIGDIDGASVSMANVFKSAILTNASKIMFFHNHPSGSIMPSKQDDMVTMKMAELGLLLDVPLVDHIIVGAGSDRVFSYAKAKPEMINNPMQAYSGVKMEEMFGIVREDKNRYQEDERVNLLKAMNRVVETLNDDMAYVEWHSGSIPDEPMEEDFEMVAEDDVSYNTCLKEFKNLIENYIDDGFARSLLNSEDEERQFVIDVNTIIHAMNEDAIEEWESVESIGTIEDCMNEFEDFLKKHNHEGYGKQPISRKM